MNFLLHIFAISSFDNGFLTVCTCFFPLYTDTDLCPFRFRIWTLRTVFVLPACCISTFIYFCLTSCEGIFNIYIQYYIYLAINQLIMNTSIIVHLLHITIISGLFFYVGLKRNTIPAIMYPVLVGVGFIILGYHMYKLYLKLSAKHNPWVNLIHILVVAPLLLFIGWNRETTPRYAYELLLLLGFASFGYHGYYILVDMGVFANE
jgi:hypothetical protein